MGPENLSEELLKSTGKAEFVDVQSETGVKLGQEVLEAGDVTEHLIEALSNENIVEREAVASKIIRENGSQISDEEIIGIIKKAEELLSHKSYTDFLLTIVEDRIDNNSDIIPEIIGETYRFIVKDGTDYQKARGLINLIRILKSNNMPYEWYVKEVTMYKKMINDENLKNNIEVNLDKFN